MFAQETTPSPAAQGAESQQLDTIEVTGSRIKRLELETANPVTVIDRDDIIATGITDVGDLLQRLPSMSGSPIGTTTNNGGNGSVQIDLRGMGVNRTLTLINGRRIVDGGDFQTIPASMIDRVEILKDGGSSVYGADAVAGVVNIITRKDYTGMTLDVQSNEWFDVDGARQTNYNMFTGKNFTGGNFIFGAEYVDQTQAYQSDAPWDFFQNSYYIYPEGCENQVTAPYPTGCYPIGSSRIPEGFLRFGLPASQGGVGQGVYMNPDGTGIVPWDGRTYNYAPVNYIQTPYQRTNLFANATFDLTDTIKLGTEVRGNFRKSAQELAPQPYNSPTDPAYDGFFDLKPGTPGLETYSGISEDNYYLVQYATAAGLTPEPVTDARRRMVELPRRFTQDVTQFHAVFDLTGTIFGEIDWSAFYNKGERSRIDRDFGQFAGSRISDALGPSADLDGDGTPECYADVNNTATLIEGCVPMNFFGGPFSVTPEMLDYVAVDLVDTFKTTTDEVGLSVTGNLFPLQGGALAWAGGFGYLGQTFEYAPDSNKQIDGVTGNTGLGTEGSLYSTALSYELLAPVFDNGSQSVLLSGGLRYDEYNAFKGETTWKLGAEVYAIKELKFRATAGTVFRAPTISELFAQQVDSFPTYSDPCDNDKNNDGTPEFALPAGCDQAAAQQDSQLLAKVGGNREVKPETGDTFTAGIVFTPDVGAGTLSATLDYWDIQIEEGISSYGVQYILDRCYIDQDPAYCAFVTRNPDYTVGQVVDITRNVAEQGATGVDFEFRYGFPVVVGRLDTAFLWTHLLERRKIALPGEPEQDLSGRYTDPTAQDGGAYAQDKINYSLRYNLAGLPFGDVMVGYLGEYVSALDADTFCNCDSDGDPSNNQPDGAYIQGIDSILYHDVVAEAKLPMGFKLMAGITNLTDEAPPFIEVGFNATTDPSTYRMFGRGWFLRGAYEF